MTQQHQTLVTREKHQYVCVLPGAKTQRELTNPQDSKHTAQSGCVNATHVRDNTAR